MGLVSVPHSKRKKLRLRKSSSRDFVHHPQTSRYVETEIPPSLKYKAQHNEAKLNANRRVLTDSVADGLRVNCRDIDVGRGSVKLGAHGLYASRNKSNYRVGDLLLWVVGVCLLLLHCLERLDGNGDRRSGRCWTILAMGEHMNPGRTNPGK